MSRGLVRTSLLGLLLTIGGPSAALAQASLEPVGGGVQITREELEQRLAQYRQTAESSAYSSDFRAIAEEEAALIEQRLEEGDFKVGDQISLRVEGEDALTGTFVVTNDRTLELPVIGSIPLEGVLRSELQAHLKEELSRYIRNPRVLARGHFRVTITGAIGKAGFYVVPAEAVLTDVLMSAGGPAPNAELTKIRIERDGEPIWKGEALQQAITDGRTLDQLSLVAGDHIVVPRDSPPIWRNVLLGISSAASLTYLLMRIL